MYIALVSEDMSDEHGGPAKSVPSIAKMLSDQKIEYGIFSTFKGSIPENEFIIRNELKSYFHKYFGPKKIRFSPFLFIKLLKLAKSRDDLVLHVNNLWNFVTLSCYVISRCYKVPLIISPRGAIEPWSLNQNSKFKKIATKAFQNKMFSKSYIHITSQQELNALESYSDYFRTFQIPNGVPLDQKKELAKYERFTFLFMSRIHEKKGVIELIQAWNLFLRKLNSKYPQPQLLIAGQGDEEYTLKVKHLINKLDLCDSVSLLGMVKGDKKDELLLKSNVFVLPTYSENFGIAVAEAAEKCLPVITTTGAPWHKLIDYSCGWWIELTISNLCDSLYYSYHDKELDLKGSRARNMIVDNYSWDSLSCYYIDMYEGVFNESR